MSATVVHALPLPWKKYGACVSNVLLACWRYTCYYKPPCRQNFHNHIYRTIYRHLNCCIVPEQLHHIDLSRFKCNS